MIVLLSACHIAPLGGWSTTTPWTHVIIERGENYQFEGRVVNAQTNEPIANVTTRLEMVRLNGYAGTSIVNAFGLSNEDYYDLESVEGCRIVDTLGSTGAYQKVNEIYRRHAQMKDILQRQRFETDSTGRFALQSTVLRESAPEAKGRGGHVFQRIVVKKKGYELFSQGVWSKCEGDYLPLVETPKRKRFLPRQATINYKPKEGTPYEHATYRFRH